MVTLLNTMPMENYNGQILLEEHLEILLYDIKLDNEGNIIVAGQIVKTATFSDGEELGDPNAEANKYYTVVLKLDGNTGEIIWKNYTGYSTPEPDSHTLYFQSEVIIKLFVTSNSEWWNESGLIHIRN